MNRVVGVCDIALVTLDTLRFDVAAAELSEGRLPNLEHEIGRDGFELRHTPASFTFAAHQALVQLLERRIAHPCGSLCQSLGANA